MFTSTLHLRCWNMGQIDYSAKTTQRLLMSGFTETSVTRLELLQQTKSRSQLVWVKTFWSRL